MQRFSLMSLNDLRLDVTDNKTLSSFAKRFSVSVLLCDFLLITDAHVFMTLGCSG